MFGGRAVPHAADRLWPWHFRAAAAAIASSQRRLGASIDPAGAPLISGRGEKRRQAISLPASRLEAGPVDPNALAQRSTTRACRASSSTQAAAVIRRRAAEGGLTSYSLVCYASNICPCAASKHRAPPVPLTREDPPVANVQCSAARSAGLTESRHAERMAASSRWERTRRVVVWGVRQSGVLRTAGQYLDVEAKLTRGTTASRRRNIS